MHKFLVPEHQMQVSNLNTGGVVVRVRMEVEVSEAAEVEKDARRITQVRTYEPPDGWTMAQVQELLRRSGFKE